MMDQKTGPARTDHLRDDINSGITGDKVAFSDPAAAPLGADDEAAGFPPDAETVALARRLERGGPNERRTAVRASEEHGGARIRSGVAVSLLTGCGVLVAMVAAALAIG